MHVAKSDVAKSDVAKTGSVAKSDVAKTDVLAKYVSRGFLPRLEPNMATVGQFESVIDRSPRAHRWYNTLYNLKAIESIEFARME